MASDAGPRYEWKVVKISEDALEKTLNGVADGWEVFSVLPTIYFGTRFMGTPVPSEVLYAVVLRRQKAG